MYKLWELKLSKEVYTFSNGNIFKPDYNPPTVDNYGNPLSNSGGDNGYGGGTNNGDYSDDDGEDDGDNGGSTDDDSDCLQPDANGNFTGDVTVPIFQDPPNDCEKLKQKTSDNPIIATRLHQLKVDGRTVEKGLRVNKNPATGDYVPSPILENNSGTNHIKIPMQIYTVVVAHTHPTVSVKYGMFSAPDILKMAENIKRVQSNSTSTVKFTEITHIVVFGGKTFALRFDDKASALKLVDILNDSKERAKFEEKLRDDYESDVNNLTNEDNTTIPKQQEHLYNFLADFGLNMSVYQANYDENNRVDTWDKINKHTTDREPCK